MRLQSIARRRPDEVWAAFEPVLPPVVWKGEGRPPASNHACLHGLLYALVTGIGWEYVPPCFPSGKTIRRRREVWLTADAFREAWRRSAERYEALRGVNGDQILIDGSKKPSKKGAPPPAAAPSIVASAGPPPTSPPTGTGSSSGPS
ncbi:transposase [Limnoglobus roseus]|uniref:Transposase n=1 Tax=Limnoglobus roseus TaxID=2598579 RepID=A0A5C1AQT7_9BACT|nr:transposase [Limnoglobus roseus]QEL19554.1 transposase [Limnoglobus roseus]